MGYMRSDMHDQHQAAVAQLRNNARGGPVGGLIGATVPTLERPDHLDISRVVLLKRGGTVLLPPDEATPETLDLTGPIRQIQEQFGADGIRWMHAHAPSLIEQYKPLLSGQTAAVAETVDPDLASAFVALLNES